MSIIMTTLDESKIIPDTGIVSRRFVKGGNTFEVRYFQNRNREHCIAAMFVNPTGQHREISTFADVREARVLWKNLVKLALDMGHTPTETGRN